MHAHVQCVCAPKCVKQTWKCNRQQRCKNTGNATGQLERNVSEGPPSFHSSLPLPLFCSPSSPSLGHWGEWAAILILISLSLYRPLPERREWSPGFWNAPPLSSGHLEEWMVREEDEGREKEREGQFNEEEEDERKRKRRENLMSKIRKIMTKETEKSGTGSLISLA